MGKKEVQQKIINRKMEGEIFIQVNDFPQYEIGNHGTVRTVKIKKERKPRLWGKGKIVEMFRDDKMHSRGVALLVAKHFLQNPHNRKRVKCLDGNPENCYVQNLEWI